LFSSLVSLPDHHASVGLAGLTTTKAPPTIFVPHSSMLRVAAREQRMSLLPAVVGLAPCGVQRCSMRLRGRCSMRLPGTAPCDGPACYLGLPGLLPAMDQLATLDFRDCFLPRPGLLIPNAGAAPYGGPTCYLWLPGLLPTAALLATSGCRRCSPWMYILPLRRPSLLPPAAGTAPRGGPTCSLRPPTLLHAVVDVLQAF
jgi:hypothetical protein